VEFPGLARSTEVFDPANDGWKPMWSLKLGRYGHMATLLEDGRVLVAGREPSAELLHLKPNGFGCDDGADCGSGHCVGGICCNSACDEAGYCSSCSCAAGAPADGVCAQTLDCHPFLCGSAPSQDVCLESCGSNEDCAPGFVCAPSGECTSPPPAASAKSFMDCSLSSPLAGGATPGGRVELHLLLLAAMAALRSRGRSQQSKSARS
jgi:hypothetical protein